MTSRLNLSWRARKHAAFDLAENSTAGRAVPTKLWGKEHRVYADANFSIYSAQNCNGNCPFCVEQLRPASRGLALVDQKKVEIDDDIYFRRLESALAEVRLINPSVSITGGEPSRDPRLPRILSIIERYNCRKRTMTTNGSGLLEMRDGKRVIDWVTEKGIRHLNISRALAETVGNSRLMELPDGLAEEDLRRVVSVARKGGTRVRLSCVLLRGGVDSIQEICEYLEFARQMEVDNVVFRRLMKIDPTTTLESTVVHYNEAHRISLEQLLSELEAHGGFTFQRQVMGYYYYVEVWRYGSMDVVFEEADLAGIEQAKLESPAMVHEMVFHPNGVLASTWQPWDGVLGPV